MIHNNDSALELLRLEQEFKDEVLLNPFVLFDYLDEEEDSEQYKALIDRLAVRYAINMAAKDF